MSMYKKRPPIEPTFDARQYDGKNIESFLSFLRSGATCTTTNKGYGALSHEIIVDTEQGRVQIQKGDWVVFGEEPIARVMSEDEFMDEFVPIDPVEPRYNSDGRVVNADSRIARRSPHDA